MKRSGSGERSRARQTEEKNRELRLSPAEKTRVAKILTPHLYPGGSDEAQVMESASLGGKDSAHDVFFLRGRKPQAPAVAVKRFSRPDNAQREIEAIRTAQERGFKTLEPVGDGVFSVGDLGVALVTERMPRFKTMNQIGWQNFYAGEPEYADVATTLQAIARFTGDTHAQGIICHDRQLKNYAQVPSGLFILFDLERAEFYEPGTDDLAFHDGCKNDLDDLVGSLVEHGYLSDATDGLFVEELTANVLDPYLAGNPSEQVLGQWDVVVKEALHMRANGDRTLVGSAMGHLAMAGVQPAP